MNFWRLTLNLLKTQKQLFIGISQNNCKTCNLIETYNLIKKDNPVPQHGIYKVNLPLYHGSNATMSETDPKDIIKTCKDAAENARTLPKIPKSAIGAIDFIIATKYLRNMIFQYLSIYKSVFVNPDGGRGVMRKIQQIFNNIENYYAKDNIHIIFFKPIYFVLKLIPNKSMLLLGFR